MIGDEKIYAHRLLRSGAKMEKTYVFSAEENVGFIVF